MNYAEGMRLQAMSVYDIIREQLDDYNRNWRAATGSISNPIRNPDILAQNIVAALERKPE